MPSGNASRETANASRAQGIVARLFRALDAHLGAGTDGHVYGGGAVQRAVVAELGGGAWKMALLGGRDRQAGALPGELVAAYSILLGLALFINWMHLPRSSPLVGGLVLALMALPTIIIATRSSLKAVPPSRPVSYGHTM